MTDSNAPEWLVETIAAASRLMSANPKSIADTVWWELHKRIALEQQERMESLAEDQIRFVAEWKLVDRDTLPGFKGAKTP